MPTPSRRAALVVDDDPLMRALLARLVTAAGYAVTAADDGVAAIQAARALACAGSPPVLLVSDVDLPGLTGVALAVAVDAIAPGLPILLVSGRPLPASAPATLEGLRYAVLPKPFDIDEFTVAIIRLAAPAF